MAAQVPARKVTRLLFLLGTALLSMLAVSGIWSSRGSRTLSAVQIQTRTVQVRSFVEDLKVVGLQRQGDGVRLSLRNDYEQNVTAFVISPGLYPGTYTITFDFHPEDGIAPGDTYEARFTLSRKPDPRGPEDQGSDRAATVVAAVFEDGRGAGDRKFVDIIREDRGGKRLASRLMLPYLELVLAAPDDRFADDILIAKVAIEALSEPEKASFEFVSGFRNGKKRALIELDSINRARKTDPIRELRGSLRKKVELYRRTVDQPD